MYTDWIVLSVLAIFMTLASFAVIPQKSTLSMAVVVVSVEE